MNEKVFSRGKIFELVHTEQSDGRTFEVARRAPGVRLIIANKDEHKLLLTKEYRHELKSWDLRLPGGKVFDSLEEYDEARNTDADILKVAKAKARAEGLEEAGIKVDSLELFRESKLGATVEWNLFIFEAIDWSVAKGGQQLEVGEQIEADSWFTYNQVKEIIMSGDMQEERIALVLLQWINQQEKNNNEI